MGDKECDLEIRVTEQEREHAMNALADFNKNNYTACLQYLCKLENHSQDSKVALNKAVAEFYKSDLKKIDQFKKNLNAVFTQGKMKQDVLDDVEQCFAHYNQAILLYHQRRYTDALRIVDRIYKFIEPMEEKLARSVCLLLIDLYICTQQIQKALNIITCIENHFGKVKDESKIGENKKDQKQVQKIDAVFHTKLLRYRARCLLMTHSLKTAKTEIDNLTACEGLNTSILCLKAQLEYLQGNHKNAIKIFSSSPTDSITIKEHGESATVIFYNNMGVIHHAMGKPNLACHYFRQALKEDNSILGSLKKSESEAHGQALYTLGSSKYHELMYNLGIALLHCGQPLQAFDCLIIAVQRYHRSSRLWLRIAECCMQIHKPSNEIDFDLKRQKEIVNRVIGSGKFRKVVLKSDLSTDMKYSTESLSFAVPIATLEFASLCLRNALLLLPSETVSSPLPAYLLAGVQPPPPPPSPGPAPSAPLQPHEVANLTNSVLTASAYISLCLGDYVLTLEHAQNLLSQPKISGAHKLLGHLYAAEAFILMDKLSEAIEHLNPDLITDISVEFPKDESIDEEDDCRNTKPNIKWFPDTVGSAQALLQYNLAVALTIRGELEKAAELLKRIWQSRSTNRVPVHVVMLFLYTELQLGRIDNVRTMIKQHTSSQR